MIIVPFAKIYVSLQSRKYDLNFFDNNIDHLINHLLQPIVFGFS